MSECFLFLRIFQADLGQTSQPQATSALIESHSFVCSDVRASLQIIQLGEYLHVHAEVCKSLWLLFVYKMVQLRTERIRCPAPKRTHQSTWDLQQSPEASVTPTHQAGNLLKHFCQTTNKSPTSKATLFHVCIQKVWVCWNCAWLLLGQE